MRIAITGGPGDGKSTVLRFLQEAGELTTSSDALARQVFALDDVQAQIAALLGLPAPVAPQAVQAALSDPETRRSINRITHPLILLALEKSRAKFFEVPLLLETCLQGQFDQVWVVTCGPEERLRRLTERYGSRSAADKMMATQLPERAKLAFADQIIRTNQPFEDVRRIVIAAARDL
ncbi:MAG: dephospho-CoA kinase [Fimbriimonas sp.]